ncbi:PadR family transcriptional regulator [Microbacterium sp. No. 7]|uniref:PadR family transcriptional regulator n=1 Tax=Microbacterium sp. No. 7 TaxID=1714373 RepID=UPI0006CFF444|nr:PadR family transcriptional regulator [Microbacterium sp. No. 7]ALJ21634.1 transcriptional regulator [Microbacterium sp. No. 7]
MSVRQSLLAILDQGPCYGYQLRTEFDRRTGSTWPLNVGQIYNTLERLERDGLVEKGDTDPQGHVYWRITDAGSAEARAWLDAPVSRAPGTRDELAIKLAVAATLPGADVGTALETQRNATLARLQGLRDDASAEPGTAEELARALVVDWQRSVAEAELRWLDRVEQRLAAAPGLTLGIAAERPRRGRPVRGAAPTA